MIRGDPGVAWRTLFTLLSFVFFGIGALVLGTLVLPILHLIQRDRQIAQYKSRNIVRSSFRLFIWFMSRSGVLDYQVSGDTQIPPGTLVIANHPSLIDVIFVIAQTPDAFCVVKEGVAKNPFTRIVIRLTGYPSSEDPNQMIDRCAQLLRTGARIVMFPEATRTHPGRPPAFRRGAATVICRALCSTTPIFLKIAPPTLAKGEPWLKVPETRVHYSMRIGTAIPAASLIEDDKPERHNSRTCTERLQRLYSDAQ